MALAPEIRAHLDKQAAAGLLPPWETPIATLRAMTQSRVHDAGPVEKICAIENRFIPGPTADLPIRIYRPTHDAHRPALIFFHGGGWVLNFLDMYDAMLARLANQCRATIISVAYQKAPEHPFPTPFDDCYATLRWVIDHAEDFKIDPQRVGVAGDSAGGNLAAAVALKARDENIHLAFQLLVYPCIDLNFASDSYIERATGFGLTARAMEWFWGLYLQGRSHDENPYAVPAAAKSFSSVAPAIVITAHFDPLLSDGKKYNELLQRDGVKTIYREFADMNHGFFINLEITPIATIAIDFAGQEIKKLTQ